MPVTENSSLLFYSCHLQLVILENTLFFACYLSNQQALDDKNEKITGIDDQGLTNLCQRRQNIAVGTYSSFSLKVCLWCR